MGYRLIGDLAQKFPDGVSSCELINHPHMSQTSARNLQSMSGYKNFFVSEWFPKLCVSEALDTRCRLMSREFLGEDNQIVHMLHSGNKWVLKGVMYIGLQEIIFYRYVGEI